MGGIWCIEGWPDPALGSAEISCFSADVLLEMGCRRVLGPHGLGGCGAAPSVSHCLELVPGSWCKDGFSLELGTELGWR